MGSTAHLKGIGVLNDDTNRLFAGGMEIGPGSSDDRRDDRRDGITRGDVPRGICDVEGLGLTPRLIER